MDKDTESAVFGHSRKANLIKSQNIGFLLTRVDVVKDHIDIYINSYNITAYQQVKPLCWVRS